MGKTTSVLFIIFSFLISTVYLQQTAKGIIHFINTGHSSGYLLESNGRYGLIDTSKPYKYSEHEVEKVVIDPTHEKDQASELVKDSVQRVVDYLQMLGVKKLDFLVATHSHFDHIGGVPAVAYYFVDNSTYYYYKAYKPTNEEVTTEWANKAYFTAAYNSMKIKGATLIDVTDRDISFNLGEFKIQFLSTESRDCYDRGENCYSYTSLITIGNNRIFLQADLHNTEDAKIAGKVGLTDIFQVGHHCVFDSASYELVSVIRPKVAIIASYQVHEAGRAKVAYMTTKCNTKVYLVTGAGDVIETAAIKATLYENGYDLENTGEPVDISSFNGWAEWNEKKTYLQNGILLEGWQELSWSKGTDKFYFDDDGIMLTGWQVLDWSGGKDTFYFDPVDGYMLRDCCRTMDGIEYCFDQNGVLIKKEGLLWIS